MRLNRKSKGSPSLLNPYDIADQLLLAHLDPQQQRDYRERSFFDVQGKKYSWRINTQSISGNVYLLDKDGIVQSGYCAAPKPLLKPDNSAYAYLPYPDVWLAQKLMIESDEAAWIRVAIRSWSGVNADVQVLRGYLGTWTGGGGGGWTGGGHITFVQ